MFCGVGVLILIASSATVGHSQKFRGSAAAGQPRLDLEAEFAKLGGGQEEVRQLQEWLLPFWDALPKDEQGNLEHHSARYVLHRLFVHRYGWYIKGLEPHGGLWSKNVRQATFSDWVPPSLLGALQGQVGNRGLALTDLAVLGASVKHRNREELTTFLQGMYDVLRVPRNIPVVVSRVQEVIRYYVARFLSGVVYTPERAKVRANAYLAKYDSWDQTQAWYKAIESEHLPNSSVLAEFGAAVNVTEAIGERYGSYNDALCRDMKALFIGTWSRARETGRIRLADFYKLGLNSQWNLYEKADYLMSLGALDDSNASMPMVIIPNYLTARPNCLETTQLYAICCRNECEDLLGHLERSIGAPEAEPARIAQLVSNLGSDTVAAPRELPAQVQARLLEIAALHGGQVNLHGRLFSQWMHHAYPSECPYPHTDEGTMSSPDTWIGHSEASEEARKQLMDEACSPDEAAQQWAGELPWTEEEVLLSNEKHERHVSARGVASAARCSALLLLVGALAVVSLPQAEPQRKWFRAQAAKRGSSLPQLALLVVLVLGFACGVVNKVMLVLALGLIALSSRVPALGCKPAKSTELCY